MQQLKINTIASYSTYNLLNSSRLALIVMATSFSSSNLGQKAHAWPAPPLSCSLAVLSLTSLFLLMSCQGSSLAGTKGFQWGLSTKLWLENDQSHQF